MLCADSLPPYPSAVCSSLATSWTSHPHGQRLDQARNHPTGVNTPSLNHSSRLPCLIASSLSILCSHYKAGSKRQPEAACLPFSLILSDLLKLALSAPAQDIWLSAFILLTISVSFLVSTDLSPSSTPPTPALRQLASSRGNLPLLCYRAQYNCQSW